MTSFGILLRSLVAGLLACWVLATGARGQASERVHVIVLHTNDVHGQVQPRIASWLRIANPPMAGGLGRIGGYVNQARAEAERTGAHVLVVDGGDWFQGTPEGALDDGLAFVETLHEVGYDGMCVGNHEFDHGVDVLERLLAAARVPALLANVRQPSGERLAGTRPYRIVERGGIRIALVGLVSRDTPVITHPSAGELSFEDPIAELERVRSELEGRADWILPLTHIGVGADRELARAHPDLDLIVGGHSHTFLREGTQEGTTRIVQVGSKASSIGRVDVWFDAESKEVVELDAKAIDLYREPDAAHRNADLDRACKRLLERVSEVMEVQIGWLESPLTRAEHPLHSSPAGSLITDLMRARTGADVAIQNRGGIRASLQRGVVTRRDAFAMFPFGNHLVTLTMKGAELDRCMRRAIEGESRRGPEFSGMTVELRRVGEAAEIVRLLVGGEPLDLERSYRVVTNSFLAHGGDGYEEFDRCRKRADDPVLLRDVLEAHLTSVEKVRPPADNRYAFVE